MWCAVVCCGPVVEEGDSLGSGAYCLLWVAQEDCTPFLRACQAPLKGIHPAVSISCVSWPLWGLLFLFLALPGDCVGLVFVLHCFKTCPRLSHLSPLFFSHCRVQVVRMCGCTHVWRQGIAYGRQTQLAPRAALWRAAGFLKPEEAVAAPFGRRPYGCCAATDGCALGCCLRAAVCACLLSVSLSLSLFLCLSCPAAWR
jgi:hypothetical protein